MSSDVHCPACGASPPSLAAGASRLACASCGAALRAETRSPTGAIAVEELTAAVDGTGYREPPRARSLAVKHSWGRGLARLPLAAGAFFGGVAALLAWATVSTGALGVGMIALPVAGMSVVMLRHGLRYLLDRTRIVVDGRMLVVHTVAFPLVHTRRVELARVRGFDVEARQTGTGSAAFTRFAVLADEGSARVELVSGLLREEDARAIVDALDGLLPARALAPDVRVQVEDEQPDALEEPAPVASSRRAAE